MEIDKKCSLCTFYDLGEYEKLVTSATVIDMVINVVLKEACEFADRVSKEVIESSGACLKREEYERIRNDSFFMRM